MNEIGRIIVKLLWKYVSEVKISNEYEKKLHDLCCKILVESSLSASLEEKIQQFSSKALVDYRRAIIVNVIAIIIYIVFVITIVIVIAIFIVVFFFIISVSQPSCVLSPKLLFDLFISLVISYGSVIKTSSIDYLFFLPLVFSSPFLILYYIFGVIVIFSFVVHDGIFISCSDSHCSQRISWFVMHWLS